MIDIGASRIQKAAILVANKSDVDGTITKYEDLKRRYGHKFNILKVSCMDGTGIEALGSEIFRSLNKVRVYTKSPSGKPDYDTPIVMVKGSTTADVAERLHKEWREKLRYALLWGSAKFAGQRVGRDHILSDGDVIELHE